MLKRIVDSSCYRINSLLYKYRVIIVLLKSTGPMLFKPSPLVLFLLLITNVFH